jgi:hypothetical protein
MVERLFYPALALSIIGLLILSYTLPYMTPQKVRVCDINHSLIEKRIKTTGFVERIHVFDGGSAILYLTSDKCTIPAYLPYDIFQTLNHTFKEQQYVSLQGHIKLYGAGLELYISDAGDITWN